MVDFRATVDFLKEIHFYDVFLPFLLVYALSFGILRKSRIFKVQGEGGDGVSSNENNLYAVIALVMAVFVIGSVQTIAYINSLLLNVVVFLVFILIALMALGFVFGEEMFSFFYKQGKRENGVNKGVVLPVAVVILFIVFVLASKALGFLNTILEWFEGTGSWIGDIVVLVIIVGSLFLITKDWSSGS